MSSSFPQTQRTSILAGDARRSCYSGACPGFTPPQSPLLKYTSQIVSRSKRNAAIAMITRHNLAEQLREYQIRSKHQWASASFFSATSTSNFTSRFDIVIFIIWEIAFMLCVLFTVAAVYFRHMNLAFILFCITLLLLLCMKVAKKVRLGRKKRRRMLLPLSM